MILEAAILTIDQLREFDEMWTHTVYFDVHVIEADINHNLKASKVNTLNDGDFLSLFFMMSTIV